MAAAPATEAAATTPPRLADGVELIGEYAGSGFKEPPHIARRADGQVVQLTRLLYLVAQAADGTRDEAAIATAVTESFGRTVSADNVAFLVEEKLRPLGLLAGPDGSSPPQPRAAPLLALRFRRPLVPEAAVQRVATVFRPLFWPPVIVALLSALAAFDAWLFLSHGVAAGLRGTLYDPLLLLALFGAVILATAFHEIGHASACSYGGARPGVMGAGVYIVWPAFYCDVTDAYRLSKAGRLRTDLGGVYFNAIFALLASAAFLATGFEPLVLVAVAQHLIIVQQLMPLLRFDGYYVLSDLTGVPDILSRVKPILSSLLPGREPHRCVTELKPWVRVVVTSYIVVLVPVLALMLVSMILGAPRMFATAWDSMGLQLDRIRAARGAPALGLGVLQLLALALPSLAVVVNFARTGRRLGGGIGRWASGSAPRAAIAAVATAGAVGLAAWTWWPNGDYEPIRPGEKGTLTAAVRAVPQIAGGRPSFTSAHASRFAPVPTEREVRTRGHAPARERDAGQAGTPAAAPTPDATGTPEPVPTATATSTPDAASTATPAPTATPTPTVTPAATATPDPAATTTPAG